MRVTATTTKEDKMSKHLLIGSAAALILAASAGAAYAQATSAQPAVEQGAFTEMAEPAIEQAAPEKSEGIAMPLDFIPAESGLNEDSAIPEDGYTGTYVFPAEKGENVYSIMDGTVEYAEWDFNWGLAVSIEHADGTYSFYAHLDELDVKAGDAVTKGQLIGKTGCTGRTTYNALAFCRSTVSRVLGTDEEKSAVFSNKSAYDPAADGVSDFQTADKNDVKPDGFITDADGNTTISYS